MPFLEKRCVSSHLGVRVAIRGFTSRFHSPHNWSAIKCAQHRTTVYLPAKLKNVFQDLYSQRGDRSGNFANCGMSQDALRSANKTTEIARISNSVVHQQHTSYVQWRTRSQFNWQTVRLRSRDTVTTLGGRMTDESAFEPRQGQEIFPCSKMSRQGSRAHQVSYPMGIGGSFSGGKAAAAWSWPSAFSGKVKNQWRLTSTLWCPQAQLYYTVRLMGGKSTFWIQRLHVATTCVTSISYPDVLSELTCEMRAWTSVGLHAKQRVSMSLTYHSTKCSDFDVLPILFISIKTWRCNKWMTPGMRHTMLQVMLRISRHVWFKFYLLLNVSILLYYSDFFY